MQKGQSGDYIQAKKQLAIFSEVQGNINNLGTVNPVKRNRKQYNKNILLTQPFVNFCRVQKVQSFDFLQTYRDGIIYNKIRCTKKNI
jgi:hypothetical protein